MKKINEVFCSNLKLIRKKNGLTLEEVALKLNTTQATVSRWESGKYTPSFETIEELAAIFEVSAINLFEDDNSNTDQQSISRRKPTINEALEVLGLEAKKSNIPPEIQSLLSQIPADSKNWSLLKAALEGLVSVEKKKEKMG